MKIKTTIIISEKEIASMLADQILNDPRFKGKKIEKVNIVGHPERGVAIHLVEEK